MTIASLYQNLGLIGLKRGEMVKILLENQITHINTKAEALEYWTCMRYIRPEILLQANHCWAFELSLVYRYSEEVIRFVNNGLQNYQRIDTKVAITHQISRIANNLNDFLEMGFERAMILLREEHRARSNFRTPLEQTGLMTEREREYCLLNKVVIVRHIDSAGRIETLKVSKERFESLFTRPEKDEDDICMICLDRSPTLECGSSACKNIKSMCEPCFHECIGSEHLDKCPRCRSTIVPLVKRT
jgi:hypothetical protein